MTYLMVPGKRPRAPSFSDKHSKLMETDHTVTGGSDSLPEKKIHEVNNFLEICRFCKKNFPHGEDIFMYGYFGAFCTKQCRAKQMAIDIFMEKSQEKTLTVKKVKTCGNKPIESKDDSLGNLEKIEAPRFYI